MGLCLLAVYALSLSETGAWVAMGAITAALGIETAFLIWKDSRDERLRREQRFRTRDF